MRKSKCAELTTVFTGLVASMWASKTVYDLKHSQSGISMLETGENIFGTGFGMLITYVAYKNIKLIQQRDKQKAHNNGVNTKQNPICLA